MAKSSIRYIRQLDTLRAIAVLLVLFEHWVPNSLFQKIHSGAIGVDTFFVLSGFLITWILLDSNEKAKYENIPRSALIIRFYIRRTLRIFPIYYLVIMGLFFFSSYTETHINSSVSYFLTYTANFYFFNLQSWDGMLSHLWSLSVEEQFYLIWPGLMIFFNRKYLLYVMIFFIAIGTFSQFVFRSVPFSNYLTNACFDSFGMGAIIAWVIVYHFEKFELVVSYLRFLFLFCIAIWIYGYFQIKWPELPMYRTINSIIASYVICIIVSKNIKNEFSINSFWSNKILVYIGKISYGVYLYHYIISNFLTIYLKGRIENIFGSTTGAIVLFCINIASVMIVASLSWELLEKQILRLKKRFD